MGDIPGGAFRGGRALWLERRHDGRKPVGQQRLTRHEERSPIMAEIPEFSLSGMTAVVTGGGRSIGRGTAVALAQAGANVVVAGRDRSTLDAVAQESVDDPSFFERSLCAREGEAHAMSGL